jgi:pimeloyl-ACP methyl ester carboxylesterase
MRFSYAGGRTPGATSGELAMIPSTTYAPADTFGDLRDAGERLAQLIIAAAAALPAGVPIDVIAHSQGGLVARVALARVAVRRPELISRLGLVATIATPHHGAALAEIGSLMADDPRQALVLEAGFEVAGEEIDPGSTVVHQLAPGSPFLHELGHTPLPEAVHMLSIGGSGDLVVPLPSTELDGVAHATVSLAGPSAHDEITSTPGVARELALALAGKPPTCEDLLEAITDSLNGRTIEGIEGTIAAFRP